MRPQVLLGLSFSLFIQFWPWNGSIICPAPLASTWWGSPHSLRHSAASWAWNSLGFSGNICEVSISLVCTVFVTASFIEVAASWDFSRVCCLPLCWCWQIFIILCQKSFIWRAFLQRKEKDARYDGKPLFFFFSQESSPNEKFLFKDGEKLSASAQGQATHRENLRALQLLWRNNYNIKRSQLMWWAL